MLTYPQYLQAKELPDNKPFLIHIPYLGPDCEPEPDQHRNAEEAQKAITANRGEANLTEDREEASKHLKLLKPRVLSRENLSDGLESPDPIAEDNIEDDIPTDDKDGEAFPRGYTSFGFQ